MKDLTIVMREMISERKDILLTILFGFLAGITAVALFASSGYLISKAALSLPVFALAILTAVVKLFGLARAASRYFERLYSHRATFTILSNMRVSFYEKLEPLAPRLFQQHRSGELLGRIVGDIDRLQHFYLRVMYPPIVFILIFLVTIWFTMSYSISIAILLLFGVVLTGLVLPTLFSLRLRKTDRTVRNRRGALSADVAEFFYGFRDLKVMKQLEEKRSNLESISRSYTEAQKVEGNVESFQRSITSFVSLLVTWGVIALGSYLVTIGELDGVFLAMLVMISLTAFENAAPLAVVPTYFQDSSIAASRLSSVVVNRETTDRKELDPLPDHQPLSLTATELSFTYPGESRAALRNMTVHIPAGKKTAIVGPSGSGKSTFLQLLLKFYLAESGIEVDKRSIHSLSEEEIWDKTNVVLQENHFFYGTIRENLLLAGETLTDEALICALEIVQLHQLPLDYTILERGENLSGGEKQRLAMARAILKQKRVWLLDEPTSSVDVLTERAIFNHLFHLAEDDTVLLISHRLNNLEQMDQIIVMDEGSIVESGSYHELMKKKGYFFDMRQIEKSVLV